ncbi:MAG: ABC transporter ATP-binding protein [Acidobacteriota bacterium]
MIDIEELSYSYPRATAPAVDNLSFHVQRQEIFGFLGPSGAGKSTTQKILIRLVRDFSGTVRIFGRDAREWDRSYYEHIGVSFELPSHYLKLTAVENLRLFAALYSRESDDPRKLLGELGLGDDADRRVHEFSKGMKNRLNLARALLHRPELLFLDEPTTGLDPVTSRRVRDAILERRAAGATVFVTTHDMKFADEICDRVAFIVDGRIRVTDSPRQLRIQHGRRVVRVESGAENEIETHEFPLDGLGENRAFLDVVQRGSVQTMHTQETTLEEIFIRVTGRTIS